MTGNEREAVLTICLHAALADGAENEAERAEIRQMADAWQHPELNPVAVLDDILGGRRPLAQSAAVLQSSDVRSLAFEMAVCVCNADRVVSDTEREFLGGLRRELRLDEPQAATIQSRAGALAGAPLGSPAANPTGVAADALGAEIDRTILNAAILNGALELLPESLATLAIIPLQMKLVYNIGQRYGFELDRGHIQEFLATAGLGLASQVVEGFARKLVGGLLGAVGGGLGRMVGNQFASSAMSFASTYAVGHVAKQYYAGGRKLSAIELKQLFMTLSSQARGLHSQYAGSIQQQAGQVNVRDLLPLIRS